MSSYGKPQRKLHIFELNGSRIFFAYFFFVLEWPATDFDFFSHANFWTKLALLFLQNIVTKQLKLPTDKLNVICP